MKKYVALMLVFMLSVSLLGCATVKDANVSTADSQDKVAVHSNKAEESKTQETYREKSSAIITADMAKEAALSHAGFAETDVKHLRAEYDYDDGFETYEVSFYKDGYEYDYEIDAVSGTVLSFEKDYD